jgi:hypothetical protein
VVNVSNDLTPYDTGARLEPKPWGKGVEPEHYGKVDFENDESATVATVHIGNTPSGYQLVIETDYEFESVSFNGESTPLTDTGDAPGDVPALPVVNAGLDPDEPYRLNYAGVSVNEIARNTAPHIEGDPLSGNVESAKRAAVALCAGKQDARDERERVQDLLNDLFHLCDLTGLDMDELVDAAQRQYAAEIKGVL